MIIFGILEVSLCVCVCVCVCSHMNTFGHGARVKKKMERDFSGNLVVKTLPSNAVSVGSIPGWGAKIPHAL